MSSFKSGFGIIYIKELKDIIRDRRTVVASVLIPILIMPVMMLGVGAFMEKRVAEMKEKTTPIVWLGQSSASGIKDALIAMPNVEIMDGIPDTTSAFALLRDKTVDAVVVVPEHFEKSLDDVLGGGTSVPPSLEVYSDGTRDKSTFAAGKVAGSAEGVRLQKVQHTLTEKGFRPELTKPFLIERKNIVSAEKMSKSITARFMPYIVILMVITGATYPAIDLTAGEKERGTLETLLVSGVSRMQIVLGKFLTVFTVAMTTAALNLLSMAASFTYAGSISKEIAENMSFTVDLMSGIYLFITLLPLAVIFSALLMALSLYAKSFREAQTYISPLMVLAIIPAMASMMPDTESNPLISLIPVVNVSLLLRNTLMGTIEILPFVLTMASNLVIAAIALYVVFLMFRRESVLFRI